MCYFTSALTWFGVLMARPAAFVVLVCYVTAWLTLSRQSFDWHAVATVAKSLMTLFIQRAEHRDTQAIHAKLDELLRVEGRARSELTQLDDEEPEGVQGVSGMDFEAAAPQPLQWVLTLPLAARRPSITLTISRW